MQNAETQSYPPSAATSPFVMARAFVTTVDRSGFALGTTPDTAATSPYNIGYLRSRPWDVFGTSFATIHQFTTALYANAVARFKENLTTRSERLGLVPLSKLMAEHITAYKQDGHGSVDEYLPIRHNNPRTTKFTTGVRELRPHPVGPKHALEYDCACFGQ